MIQIIAVFIGMCVMAIFAGKFDAVMDMIKDFSQSPKNWLYNWVQKHPEYKLWYEGHSPLPYFAKRGKPYKAGNILYSDAWHQSKHLMLLSWAGAVAIPFSCLCAVSLGLQWYYNLIIGFAVLVFVWWLLYWIEGESFNADYQCLK